MPYCVTNQQNTILKYKFVRLALISMTVLVY